jgi:hypothetical protein
VAAWLDARCDRDPSYPEGQVRSLYLDTAGLKYLAEKMDGDFLKTKIRLRWYASDENAAAAGPVWLEVKRRAGLSRSKIRVRFLDRATDIDRLDPDAIDIGDVVPRVREQGVDAPSWLRPTLALRYQRSRWVEPESGIRIALDRAIRPTWIAGPSPPATGNGELLDAIIEFKGSMPDAPVLLRQRVAAFGGRRTSFSKYFRCYDRLVSGRLSDEGADIR